MANDVPTYNAAFGAAFATFQAPPTNTDPDSYQAQTNAAVALATAIDDAVLATGGAGSNPNRSNLMQTICFASLSGRSLMVLGAAAAVPASYTALASGIVAAYQNARQSLA